MNKNEELIPKLRFPEFKNDGGWKDRTLGRIIKERNEVSNGEYPLFSLTIENGVTAKTERYERAFLVKNEKEAYKIVYPYDFALNPMNLRFGAIAQFKGKVKVALSKYYNIFYCDDSVDSSFCEIYFKSNQMQEKYDDIATGSLIEKRRVHFSEFIKLKIPFPKKEEQQKIADCLSSLDKLIQVETERLEALQAHKKGLIQQLFPAEGEAIPKLRFPEFQDSGEWVEKELKKNLLAKPEYGINAAAVPYSKNLPTYLRITDISDEGNYKTEKKVSVAKPVSKSNYLSKGDLVITRTGASVGKSYLYKEEDGKLVFAGFLIRVKPDSNKLLPNFLAHFLTTDRYWEWVVFNSTRSGQPGLNGKQIESIQIPMPPSIVEQKKNSEFLSSINDEICFQSEKIEFLKSHKKGLLQQLFPQLES
jgi:type I restriction enzyme, S subunit